MENQGKESFPLRQIHYQSRDPFCFLPQLVLSFTAKGEGSLHIALLMNLPSRSKPLLACVACVYRNKSILTVTQTAKFLAVII